MGGIANSLAAARRRSDALVHGYRQKASVSALTMTGVGQGTLGQLQKQTSLAQHKEQYRYNVNWPNAIIKVISDRIAGQPLRVARVVTKEEVRELVGIVRKGTERQRVKALRRLRRIRACSPNKKFLPGHLKHHHANLEVLEDHPILRVVAEPNPIMVRWSLVYMTVGSMELTGKGYWWFDRVDGWKNKFQLWPIPSSWIEPVHDQAKQMLYAEWEIRPPGTGENVRVPGNAVGYMYYPDPANPLGAISVLQSQARSVIVDEGILECQRRSFANELFPGMAVVIGRNPDIQGVGVQGQRPILSKEQRAQIIGALKQAYRGAQNAGEPIILDGLVEDIKPTSMGPREMAYMESSKLSKERLTQAWGVNPISMGQVEGANRASSAMADDHLCSNVINPRLNLMSEILTRWMPPLFGHDDNEIVVYFEAAQSYDPEIEMRVEDLLMKWAAMSRNELRQRHGLPPVRDGDSVFVQGVGEVPISRESDGGDSDGGPQLAAGYRPSRRRRREIEFALRPLHARDVYR